MIAPQALLDRYGSPLYHYRAELAQQAATDLREALPQPSRLYYSVKANPHPDLVHALAAVGCGAEITSPGELDAALDGGMAPGDVLYTGPAKTPAELAAAVDSGIRRFSVESPADLRRVSDVAAARQTTVECLLRMDVAGEAAAGLRMTGAATQFGSPPERFTETRDLPGVRVSGAHFYSLSNARDEDSLIAELSASVRAAAALRDDLGLPMDFVDLGGGFAAPYAIPGDRPRYGRLRAALEDACDRYLPGWREGSPVLAFESGRYLVADCGTLVCTVMDLKCANGVDFVVLDSGINHLGGMAGLGRLVRPQATPEGATPDGHPVTLVGPLCTPLDVLGRGVTVPPPAPGKPVVFPNVGAYGLTASLVGFLGRPAPVEVVTYRYDVLSASRIVLVRSEL